MTPPFHLFASLIFAFLLYPFFGIYSLLVLIGGFLTDLDHYIWYIYLKKDLNLIKTYKFYLKILKERSFSKQKKCFLLFHSIEFLIIMIILAFYSQTMFIILLGFLFHYLIDAIAILSIFKKTPATYSLIWWFFKYRD